MKKIAIVFSLALCGCVSTAEQEWRSKAADDYVAGFILDSEKFAHYKSNYEEVSRSYSTVPCKRDCKAVFDRASSFLLNNSGFPLNAASNGIVQAGPNSVELTVLVKKEKYLDTPGTSDAFADALTCAAFKTCQQDDKEQLVVRERTTYTFSQEPFKVSGFVQLRGSGSNQAVSLRFNCAVPKQADFTTVSYQSDKGWQRFLLDGMLPSHKSTSTSIKAMLFEAGYTNEGARKMLNTQAAYYRQSADCYSKSIEGYQAALGSLKKVHREFDSAVVEKKYQTSAEATALDDAGLSGLQSTEVKSIAPGEVRFPLEKWIRVPGSGIDGVHYVGLVSSARTFQYKTINISNVLEYPNVGIVMRDYLYAPYKKVGDKDVVLLAGTSGHSFHQVAINNDGSANRVDRRNSYFSSESVDTGVLVFPSGTFKRVE